jgi:hypothetical protein
MARRQRFNKCYGEMGTGFASKTMRYSRIER